MMIPRPTLRHRIQSALQRRRVVVLVGPRQCGKTTLARTFVSPESLNYFDLEDPVSLARLDQPMTALRDLQGLVVIDEVQRRPDHSLRCPQFIRRARSGWVVTLTMAHYRL